MSRGKSDTAKLIDAMILSGNYQESDRADLLLYLGSCPLEVFGILHALYLAPAAKGPA